MPVILRLVDSPAKTVTMRISTSRTSLFYRGDVAVFVNGLERVDRLTVRLNPYSENLITATFPRPAWLR